MNGIASVSNGFSQVAIDTLYFEALGLYTTVTPAYTVVPGVYGFGTDTRAAYGGAVDPVILHVNTLVSGISNTDSTHGSFEWAVTRNYPRVVVFDVSGVIDGGTSTVFIDNPHITIAGQTAPDHICLNGVGLKAITHDVLVQHISIRNKSATGKDGAGATQYNGPNYNIVFDHLSVSWGTDENIDFWNATQNKEENSSLYNITVANCITSEGIVDHSAGLLVQAWNVSIIGNLYAHNKVRNHTQGSPSKVVACNNLSYNHRTAVIQMNGQDGWNDDMYLSYIGNHSLVGPNSHPDGSPENKLVSLALYAGGDGRYLHMADNIREDDVLVDYDVNDAYGYGYTPIGEITIPNYQPYRLTSGIDMTVYNSVLANAGTRPAYRDTTDARIISEVQNRTGGQISSVPTLPTYTETTSAFVPVANPHDMYDANYTNLEHQLHLLASGLE